MTMREILFRGKHSEKSMWDYGDLYVDHDKVYIGMRQTMNGVRVYEEVIPETVGQYTGLTDKNGKKIFEGDICSFKEWCGGKPCWIGKVFFEHGLYIIEGGPNEECETPFYIQMSRLDISEMEVIGNIHDNPELMEDK